MLSTKQIRAMKPRERRYSVADTCGLTLRVHPSGSKTWLVRNCIDGRVSDVSIGSWPEMTLMQARSAARKMRKDLELSAPKSYTLRDAFRLWCNLKKATIVSYSEERRRMETYIVKPLGNKQLDEITAPLVIKVVTPIAKDGKQATLKRVVMRLREMLDLAVCAGYIDHNPLSRVSKVFAPAKVTPMPSMPWQSLPAILESMKDAPEHIKVLFLFSLCSLLRPKEVVSIQWDWIDGDVLTIPANEMKMKRNFRLPITPLMRTILDRQKEISKRPKGKYVFCGRAETTHISKQTLAKYLHGTDLRGKLVAHGIRSMGRSWLADHQIPFDVAEMCLSHIVGTTVSRAYQRSDFLDTRRSVMDRWCSYILSCADCAQGFAQIARGTGTRTKNS